MFIGHYAPSMLGGATGKIKLWQVFIAAQLVDFAWAGFNLAGIEKTRIVEGFAGNSPLDLYYMPYTHSLLMSIVWAVLAGLVFGFVFRKQAKAGAVLFGLIVLSHWFMDLIVHKPDLTLLLEGQKYGFGLWEKPFLAATLELGLFIMATIWYLSKTVPANKWGKYYPILFIGLLSAIHAIGQKMPAPETTNEFAVSALFSYSLLALLAYGLDRSRRLKS